MSRAALPFPLPLREGEQKPSGIQLHRLAYKAYAGFLFVCQSVRLKKQFLVCPDP
jgi:hypothetical protein